MDKQKILKSILEVLEQDLELILNASKTARKAATEAEAKAEHKYDTRGTEASYLADGQARRAADLVESLAILKSMELKVFDRTSIVQISALVELEDEQGLRTLFFMTPQKGGIKIVEQEREVMSLSPESPLGEALLSKSLGDQVEIKVKSQTVAYTIVSME